MISTVQQKSGRRDQPMPGARMFTIVAMKFTAPTRDEMPTRWIRKIQASMPPLGEYARSESGA